MNGPGGGEPAPGSGGLEVEVSPDREAASERGAELIAAAAREAVSERGAFTLAISGGHSPWPMFERLAADPQMPWEETTVLQVDERVVGDDDPDRNWAHAVAALPLDRVAAAHPMPVTAPDLERAAAEYEALLPERIDLVHLGIGPDGHTASLVPGDPVLEVGDRRVWLTAGEYQGHRRMTLTYPALDAARRIVWLVLGEASREPLARLRAADPAIPAGRVSQERATVVCDRAAAGSG